MKTNSAANNKMHTPKGAENGGTHAANAKRKLKPGKIAIWTVAGLAAACAIAVVGFIGYIRLTYSTFYDRSTAEFETPGLGHGFIPQDIDHVEGLDMWLFSGYEDKGNSPIWRIDANGTASCIDVYNPDGSIYKGHGGGLTHCGNFAYLTCEGGFLVFPVGELTAEKSDGEVLSATAIAKVDVGFDPAFINVVGDSIYTGVFYYEGPYSTPDYMHLRAPDGTENHAVMYAYPLDEAEPYGVDPQPSSVFSIPDKAQGVAMTPQGQLAFSTSWGMGASEIMFYDVEGMEPVGTYPVNDKDVPLYYMDGSNLVETVEAPPMMEGVICFDDRLWLANESACNKYFFGKLYGGGSVYSMSL